LHPLFVLFFPFFNARYMRYESNSGSLLFSLLGLEWGVGVGVGVGGVDKWKRLFFDEVDLLFELLALSFVDLTLR